MQAQNYFQSYDSYFWEWERTEDGLYLTIPNAKTIAHSATVIEILDYLSDESIPLFGSLLLALIATNIGVGDSFDSILYYVRKKELLIDGKSVPQLDDAILFLEKLQQLSGYKKGEKRLVLFKTIFSDCHKRISSEKAKIILKEYGETEVSIAKAPFNQANFTNDFKVFELLNKKFPTASSIITVIEGLPTEIVNEQLSEVSLHQDDVSNKPKDFISQLVEEDKTFAVGSLIKQIWSGLTIPLHHNMPSRQPLGGISDLTNKGDFDKLLLSEFAQDDDVFMSRLANNEALYIQREVPPEADKFERIILIDSSLKNWGNAKVLNFATALAIAKHPKTDIQCKLFVLGNTFSEVLYSSVDEVIDGLGLLYPSLECSIGLQDYISYNKQESGSQEVFFVTSEDSLRLDIMQKVISDHSAELKYIITTNSDGTIQIFKVQNKGKKYIQKIVLPLDELWLKPNKKKSSIDRSDRNKKMEPVESIYPILMALPQNPIASFYLDKKYYFLSGSKTLQETYLDVINDKYPSSDYINPLSYKGCIVLFENISIKSGGVYALGKNTNSEFELFYYYEKEGKLCYLNLETKEYASMDFGFKSKDMNYKFYFLKNSYILVDLKSTETWEVFYENGNLRIELAMYEHVEEEIKNYSKFISKFWFAGNNVLKSFNKIGINKVGELVFNIHKLDVSGSERIVLYPDRNNEFDILAVRLTDKFVFPDESEVLFDKKGVLTFISSNPSIPKFYIPTSLQFSLAFASDTAFAGNNYYYDENRALTKISVKAFTAKYINPFIQQIKNHGI